MMARKITAIGGLACAMALAASVLGGCFGPSSPVEDANAKYRIYLSQVNQVMVELDESLAGFTDALSRSDVVNMDSQLDQALKSLDKLDGLEAPASMKDVQEGYAAAADALEAALRDYAALYSEIDAAIEGDIADWDDYVDRIAVIQDRYDEGIEALQAADEAAAKASA